MPPTGTLLESISPRESSAVPLRTIRLLLELVCIADIFLGALIVLAPRFLFWLFGVATPDDLLWFQLIGLMLIPGAADGLVGFRAPMRYQSNAIVSAFSRFATAAFILIVASVKEVPWILVMLAIGEALVGAATTYFVLRLPRAAPR